MKTGTICSCHKNIGTNGSVCVFINDINDNNLRISYIVAEMANHPVDIGITCSYQALAISVNILS